VYNKKTDGLEIIKSENNDSEIFEKPELEPLLNMDHKLNTEYLRFQKETSKQMYFLWQIINWKKVNERLENA